MDEILASIRKIIAEEPTPSENPTNQATPVVAGVASAADGGAPPSADLSDILDEPTEHRTAPTTAGPEQGLTEWNFTNSPTRGAAPTETSAANPFAAQEADKAGVGGAEAESPLVARLRDLATGGAGTSSGDTATAQAAPSAPAEASPVDPVSALAGSLDPSAPTAEAQQDIAAEKAKQDPAQAADKGPDPDAKDADPEESLFGGAAASGRQPVAVGVEPVEAKTPPPTKEEKAMPPAPAAKTDEETVASGDAVDTAGVSSGVAQSLAAIAAPAAVGPSSDTSSDGDAMAGGSMVADAQLRGVSSPDLTITEVLRPIVNQWLDENLPALVERAVEKKLSERS